MYLCPTTFDVFKARHSSPFSKTSGSVGKHKVNTVSTQFSHKSICWLAPLRRKSGKQNFEQSLHSVYDESRCVLHPHCARMLNFPFCLSINLLTSTNWLALDPPLGDGVVVVIVLPSLWKILKKKKFVKTKHQLRRGRFVSLTYFNKKVSILQYKCFL